MMSELVDVHNVSGVSGRNKTAFCFSITEKKKNRKGKNSVLKSVLYRLMKTAKEKNPHY